MQQLRQDRNVGSGEEQLGLHGDAVSPRRLAYPAAGTALLDEFVVLERRQLSLDCSPSKVESDGKLVYRHWPTSQKFHNPARRSVGNPPW
jgi:hypothetical protein